MTAETSDEGHAVVNQDPATLLPSALHGNFSIMPLLPEWVDRDQSSWGDILNVDEWKEEVDTKGGGMSDHLHRQKQGWQGRDLLHDVHAPVRITQYFVKYGHDQPLPGLERGGVGTILTGVVHFTRRAESHAGFCHGGSMTSVMDDVIGWNAFLATGVCRPWTGYTVQVNTSLKRPIPVNTILLVQAKIVKIVRRKVSIEAIIYDPGAQQHEQGHSESVEQQQQQVGKFDSILPSSIHATAEGLVVMNRGVFPEEFDRSSTMSTQSSAMSET